MAESYKKIIKTYRNLIYLIVIAAFLIFLFFLIFQSFSAKVNFGGVKITKIKNQYSSGENIILSGTSKNNCNIVLFFNNKMGMIKSNGNGKWIANLGKAPEGNYALGVVADDSPVSQSVASAPILVSSQPKNISLIDNVASFMTASISSRFNDSEKLIMISTAVPQVLSGNWKLVK